MSSHTDPLGREQQPPRHNLLPPTSAPASDAAEAVLELPAPAAATGVQWVRGLGVLPGILLGVAYVKDRLALAVTHELENGTRERLLLPLSLADSTLALRLLDPLHEHGCGVAESDPDAERRWLADLGRALS